MTSENWFVFFRRGRGRSHPDHVTLGRIVTAAFSEVCAL